MFDSVEAGIDAIYETIEDEQATVADEHDKMLQELRYITESCTEAALTLRAICDFLGMPEKYIIKAQNASAIQQPPPVAPSA